MSIRIDPKSPILICGMNSNLRGIISRVLNAQGHEKVSSSSELKLGIQRLETEVFDWLIIDLNYKESINAINLLHLINETPSLANMKVSLMVTEDEMPYVANAFEIGILSYHDKITSESNLIASFRELFTLRKKYHEDSRLVAAFYLNKYLQSQCYFKDLIGFYKRLASLYPTNLDVLRQYAEALLQDEQNEEAHSVLLQICQIDSLKSQEVEPLIEMATLGEDKSCLRKHPPYPNIKKALIVFPTNQDSRDLREHIEQLGIATIMYDYEQNILEQLRDIDIVLIDWQQTHRACTFYTHQIINDKSHIPIIGFFPEKTDLPEKLLDQLGFSSFVVKPTTIANLSRALTHVTMGLYSSSNNNLKLKMIRKAQEGKMQDAQIIKSEYFKKTRLTEGQRDLIESWLCLLNNEIIRAKDFAMKALNVPADTNEALILLAKAFVLDRDYENAMICYNHLTLPDSIKVCDLFDLCTHKLPPPLRDKPLDMYPPLLYAIELHNAKAFCYVHQKRIDDGIGLFLKSLLAVGTKRRELLSLVYYNLGLAFTGSQHLIEAQAAFERALMTSSKSQLSKVTGILKSIKECLTNNTPYEEDQASHRPYLSQLNEKILDSQNRDETDTCCQNIYVNVQNPQDTHHLVKKKLQFHHRDVITRN